MADNIGHSILILGMIFYGHNYGYEWWTIILILLGAVTWTVPIFRDLTKDKIRAEIRLIDAKADYFRKLKEKQ